MEYLLFKDLLIILSCSIFILLIGYRLHLPPVVGFLLAGLLAGPHGLGLIHEIHHVETLAEIGIVLLLFGIGMEFSFKKLIQIKRLFLLGGSLQVGLTVLITFFVAFAFGNSWQESMFFGFLVCMSSTAIVLGQLEQKGDAASPHGRLAISILIFQDMLAIPLILLIPLLGSDQTKEIASSDLLTPLIIGVIVLAVVFICAQKIVPRLLFLVARTRNKDLFLLSVLTLCFGVALLTSSLGLSLTIGAFLAGLIISESEYSNEAISNIFPFQALFISFFFISIGMLLDLNFVIQQPFTILSLTILAIFIKILSGMATTIFFGLPIRSALLVGISLSQIGEFAFVLARTGIPYGLISEESYQLFLAVALLTMGISPMLTNLSPHISTLLSKLPLLQKLHIRAEDGVEEGVELKEHVIIVGFGISGKNLARSCKLAGIVYRILEMNPDTVKEQKKEGEPISFGDATHLSILEHLNIHMAKAIAVVVNDPIAARRIVQVARQANPNIYIIVRARYIQEISLMNHLGADEVIPDEFGTSIEIFTRVLRQYHIPDEEIHGFVSNIRADGYELLRNKNPLSTKLSELKLDLSQVEISTFRLHSSSPLIGKRLFDSQLRKDHGMTVLLIRREKEILSNPDPSTELKCNDILVVVGKKPPSSEVKQLFGSFKESAVMT